MFLSDRSPSNQCFSRGSRTNTRKQKSDLAFPWVNIGQLDDNEVFLSKRSFLGSNLKSVLELTFCVFGLTSFRPEIRPLRFVLDIGLGLARPIGLVRGSVGSVSCSPSDMASLSCSNKSLFGRSELCSLVTLRVERLLKVDLLHVLDFMSNDLDRFCDP